MTGSRTDPRPPSYPVSTTDRGQHWKVYRAPFTRDGVISAFEGVRRLEDWPVVYLIDRPGKAVYVGETRHAVVRMANHLANGHRARRLTHVQVVVDPTFNKSAALELESTLIQLLHADGRLEVDNLNAGIVGADYHGRDWYRARCEAIASALSDGAGNRLLHASVEELKNSDLYKLSPFKAPTGEQMHAIDEVVRALLDAVADRRVGAQIRGEGSAVGYLPVEEMGGAGRERAQHSSDCPQILGDGESVPLVIEGAAGTGKTIVAIYLLKLLHDIAERGAEMEEMLANDEPGSLTSLFTAVNEGRLNGLRMGFVVPQQSLRKTVQKVFKRTPGLRDVAVLSPLDVGEAGGTFDVLVIDEAHRLSRKAAQPMGTMTARFRAAHDAMFGPQDTTHTQVDWMLRKCRFPIFLLDTAQAVRTSDVPAADLHRLIARAEHERHYFVLSTQMRVVGGHDYVREIKNAIRGRDVTVRRFEGYDFRIYQSLPHMEADIRAREKEVGLARMVAGYAWEWVSKKDKDAYDIELDGFRGRWNSRNTDWISSPKACDEVGSVHTVQGYDLNYAGVIVGADIVLDPDSGQVCLDRSRHADKGSVRNNGLIKVTFDDEDVLEYVLNAYGVLLTRGIRGTYVYVEDPALRAHLMALFPEAVVPAP